MFGFFRDKLKNKFRKLFSNKSCYLSNLKHQYTICIDPYNYYRISLNKHNHDDFGIMIEEIMDSKDKVTKTYIYDDYDTALKEFFKYCDQYIKICKENLDNSNNKT